MNHHVSYANKNIRQVLQRSFECTPTDTTITCTCTTTTNATDATDASNSNSNSNTGTGTSTCTTCNYTHGLWNVQTITDGTTLTAKNLYDKSHPLTIHKPIVVKDTPQSIGMTLPNPKHKDGFTIREIGQKIGMNHPISVMDVRSQDEMDGWIFSDMVQHFEDDDRKYNNSIAKQECYNRNGNDNGNANGNATGNGNGNGNDNANNGGSTDTSIHITPKADSVSQENHTSTAHQPALSSNQQNTNHKISPSSKKRKRRKNMPRVLNQISLEFSPTPFAKQVKSPKFVRDMDWIDSMWPRQRRMAQDYPRVQYYCLTSTAGCYTDFHVDFGGTSVWYHILSGEKIFLLIPPTEDNLSLYEKWLCRKDQNDVFFPDMKATRTSASTGTGTGTGDEIGVTGCVKITLEQGQTFIIPTGWLHAVYTPVDSLVIGGNFLHGLDIKGQLNIHCLETRTRVPAKFRFPSFVQLMFYAAKEYYKRLKDPSKFGLVHADELDGLSVLLQALKTWNVGPGGDADRFGSIAYVILECVAELRKSFGIDTMEEFFQSFEPEVIKWKANGGCVNNQKQIHKRMDSNTIGEGTCKSILKRESYNGHRTLAGAQVMRTSASLPKKQKIKLSIKRKLPAPPPTPTPSADSKITTKQNTAAPPKLHLKFKNKSNATISASGPGSSKDVASGSGSDDDDDFGGDDNAFPELPRQELLAQPSFIATRAIPVSRSRTTDLISSHRSRDDADEWLPDTDDSAKINSAINTATSSPLGTKRHTQKMTKRTTRTVVSNKKKAGGSSRSRLMKKLKF